MSDRIPGDDEITFYVGSITSVPVDLEAEASDSEDATCHVCSSPAAVIVEMLDLASPIGSAIYLCDVDFGFISSRDQDSLSTRLAANYEEPVSDMREAASLMTDGTGRSIRLRDRHRH